MTRARGGAPTGDWLLVPDLRLERWPSMDRYAAALAARLPDARVAREADEMRGSRYWARYVRYPRALRRYRPRSVHVMDHSYAHCLRAFPGVPSVVSLHDLWPQRLLAQETEGIRAAVRRRLLSGTTRWLRRATHWCALSQFTAREAMTLLELPPEHVTVVLPGVDAAFFAPPDQAHVAARRRAWLGETGGDAPQALVVLHVGSCVTRKNVETAIAAVGLLRRRGMDARLAQVGGTFGPMHLRTMAESRMTTATVQQPHVSERDLLAAYHAADVLVLPSHYEGFGLPAIEAQAAGLPVVASAAGGLPEAVGGAGLLVEVPHAAALADALGHVLHEAATRRRMIDDGRRRAVAFSWETAAAAVRRIHAGLWM